MIAGGRHGSGHAAVLRLSWSRQDPLAIVLEVSSRPDHPALPRGRWVVLRDFLRYGLEEPTGDGDVRIRPEPERRALRLELRGRARPCLLTVPIERVAAFLDATERLVPAGEERSETALDELIVRLLDQT